MYTRRIVRLRIVVVALLLVTVVAAAAVGFHELGRPTETVRQHAVVVEIPAHEGTVEIARQLESADVIADRWSFLALTAARGSLRALKAGEYEIPQGATPLDALELLESGRVRQHAVLHPEGATVLELAHALESEHLATSADVVRVASDPPFLRAEGLGGAPSVEGYLFPDTYYFVKGMRVEEMLGRMVQRLRAKLGPDIEARARKRGLSLHQLLTLASIVEREAVAPEEAPIISGVFWNRLERGMPLQADPTVQYAVGKERRTLTRADLAADHPFNTYRHPGLPPGPIASPGLRAIEAALDPAPVKFLYFVAIDERHHYFSTTMREHAAAVARYRLARANAK
jgi:peptidoglycan lytic transglycosylase G